MTDLLQCPFCGGAAYLSRVAGWCSVGCSGAQTCPAYLRAQVHRSESAAVAAWNNRPADQLTAAYRQALEAAEKAIDDTEEPAWYGYENPHTFDDGKRAALKAIRSLGGADGGKGAINGD